MGLLIPGRYQGKTLKTNLLTLSISMGDGCPSVHLRELGDVFYAENIKVRRDLLNIDLE